jgi:hypothetical protein
MSAGAKQQATQGSGSSSSRRQVRQAAETNREQTKLKAAGVASTEHKRSKICRADTYMTNVQPVQLIVQFS